MVKDGDYVDAGGGLLAAEGNEGLLQRVLWKLTVRRGSFPFLPELGSRLWMLPREKPGARAAVARQYVAEALAEEAGLTVAGVRLDEGENGAIIVAVELEYGGERLTGSVEVR